MNGSGQQAEAVAAAFLQKQGLKLLSTNYSCRFSEIGLVMQDGKTLVFVEVRMRSNQRFGGAAESITGAKQQKLLTTAQHYMQRYGEKACRFDAVTMADATGERLEWLRNAFDVN